MPESDPTRNPSDPGNPQVPPPPYRQPDRWFSDPTIAVPGFHEDAERDIREDGKYLAKIMFERSRRTITMAGGKYSKDALDAAASGYTESLNRVKDGFRNEALGSYSEDAVNARIAEFDINAKSHVINEVTRLRREQADSHSSFTREFLWRWQQWGDQGIRGRLKKGAVFGVPAFIVGVLSAPFIAGLGGVAGVAAVGGMRLGRGLAADKLDTVARYTVDRGPQANESSIAEQVDAVNERTHGNRMRAGKAVAAAAIGFTIGEGVRYLGDVIWGDAGVSTTGQTGPSGVEQTPGSGIADTHSSGSTGDITGNGADVDRPGGAGTIPDNDGGTSVDGSAGDGSDQELHLKGAHAYVEHGHGFTHELQDLSNANGVKLSGADAYNLYLELEDKFGAENLLDVKGIARDAYPMGGDNWGISAPGRAFWNPAVIRYIAEQNMFHLVDD